MFENCNQSTLPLTGYGLTRKGLTSIDGGQITVSRIELQCIEFDYSTLAGLEVISTCASL